VRVRVRVKVRVRVRVRLGGLLPLGGRLTAMVAALVSDAATRAGLTGRARRLRPLGSVMVWDRVRARLRARARARVGLVAPRAAPPA